MSGQILAPTRWRTVGRGRLVVARGSDDELQLGEGTQRTVQGALEIAMTKLASCDRKAINMMGSSRTDSGVHALGQEVAFYLPPCRAAGYSSAQLKHTLNKMLPSDILVRGLDDAPANFHPAKSARNKEYRYLIHTGDVEPYYRKYRLRWNDALDVGAMEEAVSLFVGEHDFSSFTNKAIEQEQQGRSLTRVVNRCDLVKTQYGLRLEVSGAGFLYKMVRNITGTLLHIGSGKAEPSFVEELFEKRDRCCAPPAAPPHGLHLLRVEYHDNIPPIEIDDAFLPG